MSIPPHQPPAIEAETSNTTIPREIKIEKEIEMEVEIKVKMEKEVENEKEKEKEVKVKVKTEMETETETEMKECKEKGDRDIATIVTTATATGAHIPAPQAAHHISPETIKIEKSSPSSATMHRKITTTGKVTKAPRARTLQRSQRQSMPIMESQKEHEQDKGDSPILKPRGGAGVKKKTTVRGLRNMIVEKVNAGVEMAKELENQSTIPSTTIDKVTEAPLASVPPKALQPSQRQSMRIIESARKHGKDKFAVAPARRGKGPAVAAPIEKVVVNLFDGQIAPETKTKAEMEKGNKATIKANSPILKPRAGAGVTKKTPAGSLRSRISEKGKPKGKMEKGAGSQNITATPTITDKVAKSARSRAPREALRSPQRRSMRILESAQRSTQTATKAGLNIKSMIPKPGASARVTKKTSVGGTKGGIAAKTKTEVEMAEEAENQSIAPTTIDKVTKTPHSRTSSKALHGPQRRSMRIIESMQKLAKEDGESTEGTPVEGKKRLIAVAVLIDVKPPILKPGTGAGVQKREGRSGKGRRGKAALV